MGICWYCHWGWPKAVAEIFLEARDKLDGDDSLLKYGPGHIVWSDENFDSAQWCLEHFDEYRRPEYSDADHEVLRESLVKLAALPEEARNCVPEDYDDKHPENFPPTAEVMHVGI
jgi:hypothetical protein